VGGLIAFRGTAISIAKVVVLGHDMSAKTNILYVNVDGSIVAGAEFGIALIVGCLPPLRKPLERIFKRILPDNLVERKEKSPSFVLPYFSTRGTQETAATGESHPTIFYQERTNRSDIFSAEEQENHSRSVSVKTPRTAVEDRPGSPSSIG
jgi:hypothetical protein